MAAAAAKYGVAACLHVIISMAYNNGGSIQRQRNGYRSLAYDGQQHLIIYQYLSAKSGIS